MQPPASILPRVLLAVGTLKLHSLWILLGLATIITALPGTAADPVCEDGLGTDDFEAYTLPFNAPAATCFYTPVVVGSAQVNTLRPYAGDYGLELRDGGDIGMDFGFNSCANSIDNTAQTAGILFNADDLTGSSLTFRFGAVGSNFYRLVIDATGSATFAVDLSGAAGADYTEILSGITVVPDEWYGVSMGHECKAGTDDVFGVVLGRLSNGDTSGTSFTGAMTTGTNFQTFNIVSAATTVDFFFDDFYMEGLLVSDPADSSFCANPDESNFGYEYVEGVEFVDVQPIGITFEDSFLFEGDSGNSEYLAKGYNPGSEAFLVRARLETASDLTSSKFRIAFTTGATVLTVGSGQDGSGQADNLAASDGEDGGNFNDHVQIILLEDGDHWSISAWYNVAGAGLTQLPATVFYGSNPNSPTTFQVIVNSGTSTLPASIENHTIPDFGDEAIAVTDGDGQIIKIWSLPTGLHGAEWKDQWFIGKGVAAANAFTYLDDTDQQQDDDSTCLWDLLGTATRTGSAGLAPGSTIIDPPEDPASDCDSALCVDSANVPDGWTAAALNGFLGVLLVAGIAVGGTVGIYGESPGRKVSGVVVGGFLGLGYLVALYFSLLPIWPLVLVAIVGAVVVFLKLRSGA